MKKWLLIISLVCVVWGYDEIKISPEQLEKLGISVIKIDNDAPTRGIPFNAYIDFNDKSSTTQSSSFEAIVVALYKREGERVKEGEIIDEISSLDLSNLYFELQNTQNKLKVAKDITKKDKELYEKGVISKREYQTSYLASNEMELKVKQIESTFSLFGIDPLNPKGKYGFRVIAKDSGILSVAPKKTGERIPAFTPYIRISRDDDLLARIKLPVSASEYIKKGSAVYSEQGKKIGEIQSISVVLDRASNTILATALLTTGDFKVGEMTDVYIDGVKPKHSIAIPSEAIIKNGKDYLIFLKTKDGFLPKSVKVIEERDKQFLISDEGLKVGDEIASGALIALKGIVNKIGDE
ncbi:efflux RND transporter periplasmic adaptor subunit [Helicobacter cappadocius]|uniref:Sodium:proton antiporter n=1 Tax=Helicobacter cappadocius TaxID=3063998 RepID=A0AA90PJV3_9HELI|nr:MULTISPECIES: sodium:proton antiporter [unclassified Helicobacter]MDO7253289.1 sodium:proton antiporter [Helicobacter sp. faydin-H75]MDP2539281.1 sodium:proton antiporter [Helicobacter sp. faydin-H76]